MWRSRDIIFSFVIRPNKIWKTVLNIKWMDFSISILHVFVFFVCWFEISETCVTETLLSAHPLYDSETSYCIWQHRGVISNNSGRVYEFQNLRCIIVCMEFQIKKPKYLRNQAATWSKSKHNNTIKCIVVLPRKVVLRRTQYRWVYHLLDSWIRITSTLTTK